MSDTSYAHLSIQQNLNKFAAAKVGDAIKNTGRALPCSVTAVEGSLVTVKFEVQQTFDTTTDPPTMLTLPPVTIPKAESQWLRAPTQVGDLGMVVPADTSIGAVSGLSTAVADLGTEYGNLTNLVFVPTGNKGWSPAPDPNKAWINGPAGVELSDSAGTITFIVDKATGTIQMAGSGTASGDALMRASDVQAVMNAFALTIHAWAVLNLAGGTSTPPVLTAPTATGSEKSFTA